MKLSFVVLVSAFFAGSAHALTTAHLEEVSIESARPYYSLTPTSLARHGLLGRVRQLPPRLRYCKLQLGRLPPVLQVRVLLEHEPHLRLPLRQQPQLRSSQLLSDGHIAWTLSPLALVRVSALGREARR